MSPAEAAVLTIPHDIVWPRDELHRYRLYGRTGRDTLTVLTASPDPGGIGQAIVALHEDAKEVGRVLGDSGQIGVYDVLGGLTGRGEWIVLPWSRS